jgi:exodeoxyribonuclease VII large subunit
MSPEPSPFPGQPVQEPVLTVSELTLQIKELLESTFPAVWVVGEVCDLSRPQSGHCYLTLKDARAQIPAILWRSTASRVRFELRDGLEVLCRGHLDVYAPRGRYQLIVDRIEPKGIGALELAFRQLHEKLAREGLFDPARKRPLPRFVRRVAVVTSPTGAAIRDFLEVLRRRWAGIEVLVVPVRVQGEGAGEEIAAAIGLLNRAAVPIDCLAVIRGGGSLEDLWAFNEEIVVRAIAASRIPVVSGVGHEIDVTLADLAADVRALTPSEAAERIAPAAEEVALLLRQVHQRMAGAIRARLESARTRWEALAGHRLFRRPLERVRDLARRLDELESRALRAASARLARGRDRFEAAAARLESLSPLAVLGRGYSVTLRQTDGRLIRDAADLEPGQLLRTRFARGQSISRVERIEPSSAEQGPATP